MLQWRVWMGTVQSWKQADEGHGSIVRALETLIRRLNFPKKPSRNPKIAACDGYEIGF